MAAHSSIHAWTESTRRPADLGCLPTAREPLRIHIRLSGNQTTGRPVSIWGSFGLPQAIPGPLSKRKRRLDSLDAAHGAPRDPLRERMRLLHWQEDSVPLSHQGSPK